MALEFVQVVASIRCGGEQWEAESWWHAPKDSPGWLLLRYQISTSLGHLLEDNQWLGMGCRIKVAGKIVRVTKPEAEALKARIPDGTPPSQSHWQLTPLSELRYTTKGTVNVES